jgi:hypothetical protein
MRQHMKDVCAVTDGNVALFIVGLHSLLSNELPLR